LTSLGLDEAAHAVAVDDRMRAAEGLWAIGDVTGIGAFTHLAVYQARIAADDILGVPGYSADYTALPRVTFTDPEIGSVGLSEAAARAAGLDVRTGTAPVSASSRGFIPGPGNEGLIKLVCDELGDHVAWLDMAYPAARAGVEFDGEHHQNTLTFRADLARHNRLAALGWTVLRASAADVLRNPDRFAAQVRAVLHQRAA
jgi:pyruvate/2-oxoglutarate dehydrogenase complex dihydrolipoamide dehydrogenase (E3) component